MVYVCNEGLSKIPSTARCPAAVNSVLAEAEVSRFMAEHATKPDIESFAEKRAREHMSISEKLKRIAGNKGINLLKSVAG